jgi:hypothetical protein
MLIPTEVLRQIRGETSEPLVSELSRLLAQAESEKQEKVATQVKSDLVVRGLSLFVRITTEPTAAIYFSRKEIPGYVPIRALHALQSEGWSISNDFYGEEFAVAWKRFPNYDRILVPKSLAFALEALGAPQKHSWALSLFPLA